MAAHKYKPPLLVLPEDDANRQIANGFLLNSSLDGRAIQVLTPCGGWEKVLDSFKNVHVPEIRKYKDRRVFLLIDFDGKYEERLSYVKKQIPVDLIDRVFVLGAEFEPERMKGAIAALNTYEAIGTALSKDCSDDTYTVWKHDLLKHNQIELDRMILSLKPSLFK